MSDEVQTNETEVTTKKSIVPAKYGDKYKKGGSDALANFINEQASGKDGFECPAFFALCRANGLPEEKIAHYEQGIAEKLHGIQGRARMTLRNMLATIARKDGKLKNLSGEEVAVEVAAPRLSGAAAAAHEQAAETATEESGSDEA